MLNFLLKFTPVAFVENLPYMGVGMLCIFAVIGILIGSTMLLNRLFRPRNEEK